MFKKNLPRDWLLVLGLTALIYLFFNLALPRLANNFIGTYVIQPATWGLLAYLVLRLPRYKGPGKPGMRAMLLKIAAGFALLQVYLAVIAGLFDTFGRSPNSFTLKGILINLVFVSATLVGMELSRAWLIHRLARKPSMTIPFFIALLYAVYSLPMDQTFTWGGDIQQITQFWGSRFLPAFMESLLASFLAMWGGVQTALVYRGILQAFIWFCPVLPDLNWAMKALVGTIVPIVGLVVVEQVSLAKVNPGRFRRESGKGILSWVVISVAAVIMVWFSAGVFPVRPTVIMSGSMRPVYEVGDIVIVARINPDHLKAGDVIQFRQKENTIPTVHRIIDKQLKDNNVTYTTKGDANRIADTEPVLQEQVKGKVVFVVPKAGWVTITVRQLFA